MIEDNFYHCSHMSLFEFCLNKYLQMRLNKRLMKLNSQHSFFQQLLTTYQRDYDLNILNLEIKQIKWYRRLIYTNEYRFIFKSQKLIKLRKTFAARIVVTFTMSTTFSISTISKIASRRFSITYIANTHMSS